MGEGGGLMKELCVTATLAAEKETNGIFDVWPHIGAQQWWKLNNVEVVGENMELLV